MPWFLRFDALLEVCLFQMDLFQTNGVIMVYGVSNGRHHVFRMLHDCQTTNMNKGPSVLI